MERLAEAMGMGKTWTSGLSEKVKKSYQRFWNSETGCLSTMSLTLGTLPFA
jgi:hypothetical protein